MMRMLHLDFFRPDRLDEHHFDSAPLGIFVLFDRDFDRDLVEDANADRGTVRLGGVGGYCDFVRIGVVFGIALEFDQTLKPESNAAIISAVLSEKNLKLTARRTLQDRCGRL